ncbi:MAG: CPBP family glutamic-type intramembrane protease [Methanosphaera sp.]|nr:CPBP family glutamic-type intramembrane protease [Methanosphaera sp.]
MSDSDYFNFENKELDFPFYNNNPHVSKMGWIVLIISMFVSFLVLGLSSNEIKGGILFCSILLIAVLHYLDWDYKAIFQRPKKSEIKLAVLLFVGYIVYAVIVGSVLDLLSLSSSGVVSESSVTIYTLISLFPSLMGEELFKFIPFMLFMRLIYKFSNNRKVSITISMILVMLFFALLHLMDLQSLVSVIAIQGFGSIFEFYGYIKTKNLWIPYITHLCTDLILFSVILFAL